MKLYKIKRSEIDNKGRGLYATRDIKEFLIWSKKVGNDLSTPQIGRASCRERV